MHDTCSGHRHRSGRASRRQRTARARLAVSGPRHGDAARRRPRSERAAHGRRRRPRGTLQDRRRSRHILPNDPRRRRVRRATRILSPLAVEKMTSAATRCPRAEHSRARLGHRLGVLVESRRTAAGRIVRPHGLHRHVALDRSGDRMFVIFLSNRVHPDGKGDVTPLRARVATVAASAVTDAAPDASAAAMDRARLGAVGPAAGPRRTRRCCGHRRAARASGFAPLRGKRVGLVTNHTGRARDGATTIDLLFAREGREARRAVQPGARHPRDAGRQGAVGDRREDRPADLFAVRRDAPADRRDARRASTRSSSTCRTSARASTPT